MQHKTNIPSSGIYARRRSGFTVIELLVGVVVIGMLILALYLYQQGPYTPIREDTDDQTQTDQESPTPLPTDSSDEELNQSAAELNLLSHELDTLDDEENDTVLPSIDFVE